MLLATNFCFLPEEWAVWRTVLEFQGHSRRIGVLCSPHVLIVDEIFCAQCCFTLEKASLWGSLYSKFILIKPRRSILILQLFGSQVWTMTSILPRVRDILNDWSCFQVIFIGKSIFWKAIFEYQIHSYQINTIQNCFHCYLKALWCHCSPEEGMFRRLFLNFKDTVFESKHSKKFFSYVEHGSWLRVWCFSEKAPFEGLFVNTKGIFIKSSQEYLFSATCTLVSKFSEDGIFSWAVLKFQSHSHRNWLIQYLISATWKGCSWTPRLSCT